MRRIARNCTSDLGLYVDISEILSEEPPAPPSPLNSAPPIQPIAATATAGSSPAAGKEVIQPDDERPGRGGKFQELRRNFTTKRPIRDPVGWHQEVCLTVHMGLTA
jgi:hypothetical protein